MFDIKYYKIEKMGVFKRMSNACIATFNAFWTGLGNMIGSPLVGLNTFFVSERTVLDLEKLKADRESYPNISGGALGHFFDDDDEDWKRAHRKEYGE